MDKFPLFGQDKTESSYELENVPASQNKVYPGQKAVIEAVRSCLSIMPCNVWVCLEYRL